jgi:hypothetical protein
MGSLIGRSKGIRCVVVCNICQSQHRCRGLESLRRCSLLFIVRHSEPSTLHFQTIIRPSKASQDEQLAVPFGVR